MLGVSFMATTKKTDISAAIKAANKSLGAALAAGDAAGMAGKYTKTGVLMPPNAPACKGARAIAGFWKGAIGMGVKAVNLRSISVEQHGTTANEYGAYTLKDGKGATLDAGKYVVVWKREGKDWKLHWDIFNSNK
jgi:ketosteroid isomerase-like protein